MNYSRFCQHEAPLHTLTKKEIERPYLVLDDLCNKRCMEGFQNELQAFLSIIFKPDGWKAHDPGVLYETYKDLVRLIDVLYLVNKYSPALSSVGHAKGGSGMSSAKMTDLNCIFKHGMKDLISVQPVSAENEERETVLGHFYSSYHIGFLKIDLNCCVQVALDASYMTNDKYEYFALEQSAVLISLNHLHELIAEAYIIYSRGKTALPVLECCFELAFAKDKDHPTYLLDECIANPMDMLGCFYDYYLMIDHLHKGLKTWKKMLFVADFWKNQESPGNLIYLHNCIAALIDACWLSDKKGQLRAVPFDYSKYGKQLKATVRKCNKAEREFPLMVIRNFFSCRNMHEWKFLLNEWLECSLSNTTSYDDKQKKEVNKSFKCLIKLMEAVYLINLAK